MRVDELINAAIRHSYEDIQGGLNQGGHRSLTFAFLALAKAVSNLAGEMAAERSSDGVQVPSGVLDQPISNIVMRKDHQNMTFRRFVEVNNLETVRELVRLSHHEVTSQQPRGLGRQVVYKQVVEWLAKSDLRFGMKV